MNRRIKPKKLWTERGHDFYGQRVKVPFGLYRSVGFFTRVGEKPTEKQLAEFNKDLARFNKYYEIE